MHRDHPTTKGRLRPLSWHGFLKAASLQSAQLRPLCGTVQRTLNVSSWQDLTFSLELGYGDFVPKDFVWWPRWRETQSLSQMPDKQVFPIV